MYLFLIHHIKLKIILNCARADFQSSNSTICPRYSMGFHTETLTNPLPNPYLGRKVNIRFDDSKEIRRPIEIAKSLFIKMGQVLSNLKLFLSTCKI